MVWREGLMMLMLVMELRLLLVGGVHERREREGRVVLLVHLLLLLL